MPVLLGQIHIKTTAAANPARSSVMQNPVCWTMRLGPMGPKHFQQKSCLHFRPSQPRSVHFHSHNCPFHSSQFPTMMQLRWSPLKSHMIATIDFLYVDKAFPVGASLQDLCQHCDGYVFFVHPLSLPGAALHTCLSLTVWTAAAHTCHRRHTLQ